MRAPFCAGSCGQYSSTALTRRCRVSVAGELGLWWWRGIPTGGRPGGGGGWVSRSAGGRSCSDQGAAGASRALPPTWLSPDGLAFLCACVRAHARACARACVCACMCMLQVSKRSNTERACECASQGSCCCPKIGGGQAALASSSAPAVVSVLPSHSSAPPL